MTTASLNGHPKGRRYPQKVVQFARDASARGYTWQMIAAAIEKNGYPAPARWTITNWIDPNVADARRASQRKRTTKRRERKKMWRIVLDRMEELRSLRVSYRSIAAIVNHDFDLALSTDQARYILTGRLDISRVEKLLSAT